jgi:tetratricopeptide (TPR) repeat protein
MDLNSVQNTIEEAKRAFEKGDYKSASKGFKTAYNHFEVQNDPENAAEMANNLCVALLQIGKKKEALEIVEGTAEFFEKQANKKKQAIALGNQAAALEALKRFDEALNFYQQSADIFDEIGESALSSHVHKSIALIQVRNGKQLEGIFSMQKSLGNIEKPTVWQRIYRGLLKIPNKLIGK